MRIPLAIIPALVALAALVAFVPTAGAASPLQSTPIRPWQPNGGAVREIVPSQDGSRAFLGGTFKSMGPFTGGSVRVNSSVGIREGAWPTFAGGHVWDIVADPRPAGGWFVAGGFTRVGLADRSHLVRIDATGRLDPLWNAGGGFDGAVRTLALDGNRLLAGGEFTNFNGAPVGHLVAFNLVSSTPDEPTAWTGAYDSQGIVEDIEVHDQHAWIAGSFTGYHDGVGYNTADRFIVPLNLTDGRRAFSVSDAPNAPATGVPVHDLAIDPARNRVFAGGTFETVGASAIPRSRLAAYTLDTGALVADWKPSVNRVVNAVTVHGAYVYAGGRFDTVDGVFGDHKGIVRLGAADGARDSGWRTQIDDAVTAIKVGGGGSKVYVGGWFTRVDGAVRHGAASISTGPTADVDPAWSPMAGRAVEAFAQAPDGSILMGGRFSSVGVKERRGLAAIDLTTGALVDNWNPVAASAPAPTAVTVNALVLRDGTLYAGGTFDGVAQVIRVNSDTGLPLGFSATFSGTSENVVRDMAFDNTRNRLIVGGSFPGHIVALDPATGAIVANLGASWGVDSSVDAMHTTSGRLYVGGNFNIPRPKVAAFSLAGDTYESGWNPGVSTEVGALTVDDSLQRVYIASADIGATRYVKAVDSLNGADITTHAFNPAPAARIAAMVVDPSRGALYIGGEPDPSQPDGWQLTERDASGGQIAAAPRPAFVGNNVNDIAIVGSRVLVAANFGIAIYEPRADVTPPAISSLSIDADPTRGTLARGDLVVARTNGPVTNPSFTTRVRAQDALPASGPATYAEVSGLDEVRWGAVPDAAGTWNRGSTFDEGHARGLALTCWQTSIGEASGIAGTDTAVNYPLIAGTARVDQHPSRPARVMREVGAPLLSDAHGEHYNYVGCRWRGHLVGRDGGDHVFRQRSDNGMELSVGSPGDGGPWPTIDNWAGTFGNVVDSAPMRFEPNEAKLFNTRWYDGTNEAYAQVLWDTPPLDNTYEPVPEGAFVRGVDYERTYRFEGGTPDGTTTSLSVDAVDRAGLTTAKQVRVAVDNEPPRVSPIVTSPVAGTWNNSATITIAFSDALDDGEAGFRGRQLQIRDAPFDAGGGCAPVGVGAEDSWRNFGALWTGSPVTTTITETVPVTNGCWQVRILAHDLLGNERKSYPAGQGPGGVEEWVRIDHTPATGGSIAVAAQTTAASSVDVRVEALPSDANSGMETPMYLERLAGTFAGGGCSGWATTWGNPVPVSAIGTYPMTSLVDGSCYRFRLAGSDFAGNRYELESPSEVRVDQSAPAATLDPLSATGVVGSAATVTGSMSDAGSGIGAATVTYSGPQSGTICSPTAGSWSCPWDTSALQEGDYTVTFQVFDSAGSSTTRVQPVRVDRSLPVVTLSASELTQPQFQHSVAGNPASLWINPAQSGSLKLHALVSDASASHVEFPAFGPNWTPTTAETISAPAAFERTYAWAPGAAAAGSQSIVAWDMAGASSTASVNVIADVVAPTAEAPAYTGGYGTATRWVSWDRASALDDVGGSGVAALELQVAEAPLVEGACGAWGAWSGSLTVRSPYEAILTEGTCSRFQIVARDNVGNERAVESPTIAKRDTTRPTSAFDAAPVGPVSGTVALSGSVTDTGSGGASVDVYFVGPTREMACDNVPVSGGSWACSWDTKTTTASMDGTYTLHLVATDVAGNVQDPVTTRSLVVDNQAPTLAPAVTPLAGSEGAVYHDPTAKTIWFDPSAAGGFRLDTGAMDAGTGVASARFRLLGVGWTPLTPDPYVVHSAPWAIDYQWSAGATVPAEATSYTVVDAAGSSIMDSFTVRADTAAPSGGSVNYANAASGAPQITFVVGSDAGSGVKSWHITRRETAATSASACDEAGWQPWAAISPERTSSPYADDTIQRSRCYEYQLVVVDHVGKTARYADPEADRFITLSPGIVLGPAGVVPATAEGGATASYEVSLRSAPTADVTISLTGDADAAPSPARLTFTTANWDTPQRVTVTAIDDAIDEASPETASISHDASSIDSGYDMLPLVTQNVTVDDNDQAAVVLTPTDAGTGVTEGGPGDTYSIRLGSKPTADVSVTLAVPAQLEATPRVLRFTPQSWSGPQTVAVAAAPDADIEGPHGATIGHAVESTDPAYRFRAGDVAVTIADDDVANLEVVASSAAPTVSEQPGGATESVRVRLTARPSSVVNVGASGAAGQVAAAPSSLQFTPDTWGTYQTITLSGVDDTRAESSPHAAMATFSASSTDPNFASVAERVISLGVTDNDQAGFVSTPGAGWTRDAEGRLQLAETGERTATITITAMGDPSADVVLVPELTPAGEVVVAPAQATFPAGSHNRSVTFTVHAVDDRVAEPSPHPARLELRVRTQDPMYGAVTPAATSIVITDGAEPALRQEQPAPTQPVKEPVKQPTPDATDPAPVPPASDPVPPASDPVPPVDDAKPLAQQPAPKGDDTREQAAPPKDSGERKERRSAREEDEGGNLVSRAAGSVKEWAKENKAAAGVGASAAGTAAIWGAKPLMLAGKALGSGGLNIPGMPGPDGMGQVRRLLRAGRKTKKTSPLGLRLLRALLRRGRDVAEHVELERTLEQDWDDFYDDRAA